MNTLEEGLKLGFEAELEKNSEVLGRNAKWKTVQRLHSVPLYLAVQFNRFYWKLTPNSRDHGGVNCKIKRPVKFPLELDIHEFCDDHLKSIMKPARDRHTAKLLALTEAKLGKTDEATEGAEKAKPTVGMGVEEDEEDKEIQAAMNLSLNEGLTAGPGVSPNFRGIYELYGVVTHQGRSSDSGHYIGWVKQGPGKFAGNFCYV